MMLRSALCAAVFLAVAVPVARTQDAPGLPDGNYLLSTLTPTGEAAFGIIKAETKEGKTTLTVVATPPNIELDVVSSPESIKSLSFTLKQTRLFKTQQGGTQRLASIQTFVAAPGKGSKVIFGSMGLESGPARAKMVATEKEALAKEDLLVQGPANELIAEAQKLNIQPLVLRSQARAAQDAEKKQALLDQAEEAGKLADSKLPVLYREVVSKYPDSPAAADAAMSLITTATKSKVTPAEADALVKLVEKQGQAYGPRYTQPMAALLAKQLVLQKGLEGAALGPIEPIALALTDKDPATTRFDILTVYKAALEGAGKSEEAKAVGTKVAALDAEFDREYLAAVPPFKPKAFEGRKEKDANQVAVMELFTGAQCPPCVAADVAFDALEKAYKPTELILIQYHMHIPGPDPMTNPDTIARWDYYQELFPAGIRGTPTTLFNGKIQAGGGGSMAGAEGKFNQYRSIINPILEKTTPTKLTGTATRGGEKVEIAVNVTGAPGEGELKLRLLLVEDTVKYVGGNKLRFHHHVVRAMPGGAAGVAVKEGDTKHTATADLAAIRKNLTKYLDEFAAKERPFPTAARPLALEHLKLIALLQDDKTGEVLQAVQIDVTEKVAAAGR